MTIFDHAYRGLALATVFTLVACHGKDAQDYYDDLIDDGTSISHPLPAELAQATTPQGTPEGTSVSKVIGPTGGTLTTADGRITVEVPAGAFLAERTVKIQPITNTSHGGVGMAYRITPEGLRTLLPMTIRWHWADEDIAGTAPGFLAAGYRDANGLWRVLPVSLNREARTLSVNTYHFSDWSMLPGAILTPALSTVRTNETADLRVAICGTTSTELDESDIPMPGDIINDLLGRTNNVRLPCKYDASTLSTAVVSNWSINGIPGGNATVGWITAVDNGTARYTAPAIAPSGVLAASVDVQGAEPVERQTLVASIKVTPAQVPVPPTSCDSYYGPHTKGWSVDMTVDYSYSDSAAIDGGTAYLTVAHQATLHATLKPVDDNHFKGAFDSGSANGNTDEVYVYPKRPSYVSINDHKTGLPDAVGSEFNLILNPDCSYMVGASIGGIGVIRTGYYQLPVDVPYATQQVSVELPGRSLDWGDQYGDPAFFPYFPFTRYVELMGTAASAKVTWTATPIY
jgi:hypothetical protein